MSLRFCGISEPLIEEARRRQYKWNNKRRLKWFVADRIPGIPLDALTATYAQAFAAWQAVCGLTFAQTTRQSEADFIILTRSIDGRSGTLAEHELPNGSDRPIRGWFDLGESWHVGESRPTGSKVDLLAVATHEFGHGIGLSHEGTRGIKALLDPYYDPAVRVPQEWDIEQAQSRYGPPVEEPKIPTQPEAYSLTIQITDSRGIKFRPTVIYPEQS